jgi:hypothetical protein
VGRLLERLRIGSSEQSTRFCAQTGAQQTGTVPPTATRLAELVSMLQGLRSAVEACLHEYEVLSAREDAATGPLSSIGYSVRMNNLKIDATEELPRIVQKPCRSAALWPIKTEHRSA